MMKKIFTVMAMMMLAVTMHAQKFALIDMDYILKTYLPPSAPMNS